MTLFDRIANLFSRKETMPQQQIRRSAPLLWLNNLDGAPQWNMINVNSYYHDGFTLNSVIYAAVMYKVRAITQANLTAYMDDVKPALITDKMHPLYKLTKRPNPYMSGDAFLQLQETYLNLAGNAFTYIERANDGTPISMLPLNPSWVQIIPGSGTDNVIKGYLYNVNGLTDNRLPILPQNMMHVKYPNPGDPLNGFGFGLSPVAPLAQSGDVDNNVTNFLNHFFRSGAMPAGILKFKDQTLSDDQMSQIKESWRKVYGGVENWTDVVVLDQYAEYDRIGLTFDEMGFEQIDSRNEERMIMPFGVPPILIGSKIGLEHSTYSNFEEARRSFWQDTMVYELSLFLDEFQHYLYGSDGSYVDWDLSNVPALKENLEPLIKSARILYSMGMPAKSALDTVGVRYDDFEDRFANNQQPDNQLPADAVKTDSRLIDAKDRLKTLDEPHIALLTDGNNQFDRLQLKRLQSQLETDLRSIAAIADHHASESRKHKSSVNWNDAVKEIDFYFDTLDTGNMDKVESEAYKMFAGVIRGQLMYIMNQATVDGWTDSNVRISIENLFSRGTDIFNRFANTVPEKMLMQ